MQIVTQLTVAVPGDAELGIARIERRFEYVDRNEAFLAYQRAIRSGLEARAEQVRKSHATAA